MECTCGDGALHGDGGLAARLPRVAVGAAPLAVRPARVLCAAPAPAKHSGRPSCSTQASSLPRRRNAALAAAVPRQGVAAHALRCMLPLLPPQASEPGLLLLVGRGLRGFLWQLGAAGGVAGVQGGQVR